MSAAFEGLCEQLVLEFVREHPNCTPSDFDDGFGFRNGALDMMVDMQVPRFNRSPFGRALLRLVKAGKVIATQREQGWYYLAAPQSGAVR